MTVVLTVIEAARLLGISRGLAYEAVRLGQIPSVRVGRRILIPRAQLERMLGESDDPQAVTKGSSEPNSPIHEKGCGCAQD